jgi:hypothetical protein
MKFESLSIQRTPVTNLSYDEEFFPFDKIRFESLQELLLPQFRFDNQLFKL